MKAIYLDNAATTPVDPAVVAAMQPFLTELFYNPSAQYQAAREVKQAIETARGKVAHYFGARPSEMIFTAGGTEANNLAIKGIMDQFPDANVLFSAVEHESVIAPSEKYIHTQISVHPDGQVNLKALEAAITDQTVLVSVQYVNNEVGTIQPLREIAQVIGDVKQRRKKQGNELPLYFHTDACQAPAYMDLHAHRLGVDLMTINASKIYGPKQIGALFVKAGTPLKPLIDGGGQEKNRRSGTENVAAIMGFATALELVQERRHEETTRLQALQQQFFDALESRLPNAVINGSKKHRIVNNVHITLPAHDNETLMMQLDDRGIICAVGSACSASNEEPSHVLRAMGMDDEAAQSSLRFTMGKMTTAEDISTVIEALVELTA